MNQKPYELDPNHLKLLGKCYVWVRYVTTVIWVTVAKASKALKQGAWNLSSLCYLKSSHTIDNVFWSLKKKETD